MHKNTVPNNEAPCCKDCGVNMTYFSSENIQLGKAGILLGTLPNLVAGAVKVDMYVCPECHKLELYLADEEVREDTLPQTVCPICKKEHDFDFPKCPHCGYVYS